MRAKFLSRGHNKISSGNFDQVQNELLINLFFMFQVSGLLAPSALALAASPGALTLDSFKNLVQISSLRPYDKNVDCRFVVVSQVEAKSTKEGGTVYEILVADESGSMLATFWDDQGAAMKPGDVILMRAGLVTIFKGHLRLACKHGSLIKIDR